MKKLHKFIYRVYYDTSNGKIVGGTFAEIIAGWCKQNGIKFPPSAKFPVGSCIFISDLGVPLVHLNGRPKEVIEAEMESMVYLREDADGKH